MLVLEMATHQVGDIGGSMVSMASLPGFNRGAYTTNDTMECSRRKDGVAARANDRCVPTAKGKYVREYPSGSSVEVKRGTHWMAFQTA